MVDRIRLLKKAVSTKNSPDEKYDLIIKAIEESESMNQSSNDIFACFHEFVLVPLRTVYQMYKSIDQFMLSIYSVLYRIVGPTHPGTFDNLADNPLITQYRVKVNGVEMSFLDAIANETTGREVDELSTDVNGVRVLSFGRGIAKFADVPGANPLQRMIQDMDNNPIGTGTAQILLSDILSHFCHNSGDLAKITISTTGRITIDLSEFQTLCEYLVSNVKFMIDKFTGLVPTQLIDNVSRTDRVGSVFWLEDKLINQIFNKINKNESERSILSVDNVNKIMPILSSAIFESTIDTSKIIKELALSRNGAFASIPSGNALPVIRDAFMQYDQGTRIFRTDNNPVFIFNTLFGPEANSSIVASVSPRFGLIQEFNTLIAHYLNDLYDAQTRKMYPKLFQKFANNAFLEALNGQAFADFAASIDGTAQNIQLYDLPQSHGILSATLAYTMKTMSTRTHPISGMKIHEVANLQEVGAHVLEKYRSCLPMYLRLFKIFQERCKFYRKVLSKVVVDNANIDINPVNVFPAGADVITDGAQVRENVADVRINFASRFTSINNTNGGIARDRVLLFIDDMVSGIGSLIEDAQSVHKELREMDDSIPLFFDIKKDYTKSFYLSTKDLPFAPLSIMTMAFRSTDDAVLPFPTNRGTSDSKFLYGMQSMLIDDFKLSVSKVPYMKKLLADFNGYNTKINNITESKFNDMLGYLGRAFNFYYDWKFYNGQVFNNVSVRPPVFGPPVIPISTFQEQMPRDTSIILTESINPIDSKSKIAEYVKQNVVRALPPMAAPAANPNPRARVIMVNIIDLNIIPINVHSLMREIPLANLYNYAMSFDSFVDDMNLNNIQHDLLKKPYTRINSRFVENAAGDLVLEVGTRAGVFATPDERNAALSGLAGTGGDSSLRFLTDILFNRLIKPTTIALAANEAEFGRHVDERINSKLVHNLTFLTLVQFAIKKKVKQELDFINSRVVSNTAAVSDTITNANVDIGAVTDSLFEF